MKSEALAENPSAAKGYVVPFGKYLLLQRVSVGGMAEVFKALPADATRIDQIVAIKRILPNIAEDSEFIGMFADEARLAGQLSHPNICRIYELGAVGDDHYIAMQFLWGRDLLKLINRFRRTGQPMPAHVAAFVASKACAALHYAHNKCDASGAPLQIIHRDVSPQNIIVGYSGQVKLIDFGVARAATQSQKTRTGILKGKFGYMSPEMIRGLPVDHRSDVFAMGICLYEALVGARLFFGETDFATLELVRDANVPPPSAKAKGIPRELDQIVLKALARDAQDRYASAEDLQQALERFLGFYRPGFGEAEMGAVMRQAFEVEVAREKERLQVFSDMLQARELKRGAALPPLMSEPPRQAHERSLVGQLPGLSPADSEPSATALAQPDDESELLDEQTHIFFSADELDELQELEHDLPFDPRRSETPLRQPAISDVILRGGDRSMNRPITTSGTYPRFGSSSASRPDASRIATIAIPVFTATATRRRERTAWAMLAAASVCLLVAGYFVARFLQHKTATLEIAAVRAPDALVSVDGVVRGNPPIRVRDLQPGVHEVEVDAKGYVPMRRKLYVGAGQIRPVSVALERSVPTPRQAVIAPVVEGGRLVATTKPEAVPTPITGTDARNAERRGRPLPPRPLRTGARSASKPAMVVGKSKQGGESEQVDQVSRWDVTPPADESTTSHVGQGEGELLISTLPWSHVLIDSVDTGRDTPVRSLKVAAGAHRLGLRTPDGQVHNIEIYVEPGQVVRIIRRF